MNKDAAPVPGEEMHQAILDIQGAGFDADEFTFNGWKIPVQDHDDGPYRIALFVEVDRVGHATRIFRCGGQPSWNEAFCKELRDGGFGPC